MKTNEYTRHVRYFMGWVAGFRLCGADEIYKVPLTAAERAKLPHRYTQDQDDHTRLFKTKEAALSWVSKQPESGRFVRCYCYSTPTVKHAEEYCVVRDERGNLILWDDLKDNDRTEIPDHAQAAQ